MLQKIYKYTYIFKIFIDYPLYLDLLHLTFKER